MNAVVQSLKGLGSLRIVMLGVLAVALVAAFFFLASRLTNPVMSTLYSDLSSQDINKIVSQLEGSGVKYEIRAGSQVVVPADQVGKLRIQMAQAGIPSRGSIVGYEIFDKSDAMGTSSFVQNVNLLRALEGELARTISAMSIVESARVHLVVPKRELFTKDRSEPTAAVVLKLKGTTSISKSEVAAVSHLVASAVPGLKTSKVTIVDNTGNLLSRGGGDENEIGLIASTNQEIRANLENHLRGTIEELLERSLGPGKIKAQVSADIDFDRIVTNSEIFDPDGRVARSIQTSEEKESSSESQGGDVSVANNLPDAKAPSAGGAGSNNNTQKVDEITNFEISKTIKNHIKETGTIKKISVAVVVDGVYTENKETKELAYSPRSQEELDKLTSLVKTAIGFDSKRGDTVEIVNMQFSRELDFKTQESSFDWLKRDFDSILKTLVIGVVAVLVILLIIKPLVNRAFEVSSYETDEESGGSGSYSGGGGGGSGGGSGGSSQGGKGGTQRQESSIDVDKIQNKIVSSSIKKISDVVSTNPEETLGVIRTWLNQK